MAEREREGKRGSEGCDTRTRPAKEQKKTLKGTTRSLFYESSRATSLVRRVEYTLPVSVGCSLAVATRTGDHAWGGQGSEGARVAFSRATAAKPWRARQRGRDRRTKKKGARPAKRERKREKENEKKESEE